MAIINSSSPYKVISIQQKNPLEQKREINIGKSGMEEPESLRNFIDCKLSKRF